VMVPSVSSVTVSWLAVPVTQELRSEEIRLLLASVDTRREPVRLDKVVVPEEIVFAVRPANFASALASI